MSYRVEFRHYSLAALLVRTEQGYYILRALHTGGASLHPSMWVKKFKSPTVTRTKHVGQTVTNTKRGWTKCLGTLKVTLPVVQTVVGKVTVTPLQSYITTVVTFCSN